VRHQGALSFGYFSFARAKKSSLPWVSHPQLVFERRRRRLDKKLKVAASAD
jgi:hypothetical protein